LPIELDFNAEAAYSIDDDPFHYDWPFWWCWEKYQKCYFYQVEFDAKLYLYVMPSRIHRFFTGTIFLRTGETFKPQLIPSLMWWERTMEWKAHIEFSLLYWITHQMVQWARPGRALTTLV
jgi:hypothetical protein